MKDEKRDPTSNGGGGVSVTQRHNFGTDVVGVASKRRETWGTRTFARTRPCGILGGRHHSRNEKRGVKEKVLMEARQWVKKRKEKGGKRGAKNQRFKNPPPYGRARKTVSSGEKL